MQYGLGIDLGTTQTAAAVRVDGRVEIVRLGGRRAEIPSLVFVRPDGGLLIGEAAERRGQAEPGRLAREFKRRIGDPVPILAGGVPFSAHALTAKLLRHVLDAVIGLQDGPPAVLAVTHPANWGPYKREQLDQALRLADTGPVLLRTEPEAAALQHATARRIAPGETVAVYDLGGGTFDAAVLRRDGEGFQLLGEPEGIEQLGGADFDEAVFGHVLGVLGSRVEGLDPDEPDVVTALARLRRDCVEAKEALSFDTEVMIPVALPGVHTRVRLNRSELESMIAPALADTVAAMHRALRAAGVAPGDLEAVLLAGGSSRIPLIGQLLSTAFDRPVVADPHPEHSIAMGAAVATALITGGVSPFTEAVAPPPHPAADAQPTAEPSPAAAATRSAVAQGAPVSPAGTAGTAPVAPAEVAASAAPPASPTNGVPRRVMPSGTAHTEVTPPGTAHTEVMPPGTAHTEVTPEVAGDTRAATRIMPGNGAGPHADSPASDATVRDAAGHGSAGHGSAAPVAYTRGAASVPSTAPAIQSAVPRTEPFVPRTRTFPQPTSPAPAVGGGQVFASAAAGRTAPPITPGPPVSYPPVPAGDDDERPRRSGRLLVLVGAITLAVIAGTTAMVALNRGDGKKDALPPASSLPASPSVNVPPYPTDTMLIQVDTGGDQRPELKNGISLLTPGKADRETVTDPGGDQVPEWSRDRKRFAVIRYERGRKNAIYAMDADGSNPVKVVEDVTGGRVSWSPDGTRLAFERVVDESPQIFLITVGESKPTQLTFAPGMKDDPAWSPLGEELAYHKVVDGKRHIFVLDLAKPKEPGRKITDDDSGPGVDPNWSPDGKKIAYTHLLPNDKSDIWVVDSDGTNPTRLTTNKEREMDPSWSPESPKGSWLAFARGPLENQKIVIVKADGTGEQKLTTGAAREGHPCWS
ncbi:Hsp70 family protein [Actinoplanes sp. ATCC 53533]|uniref:Hsp70 family protein n=1 Tax=Actinoplanes sp. ATCC 53533 TaxID=1288362 RepID=UPI0011D0A2F6|nr:Hsp70 family protein [Actinoplanes sp. ATCC 53533]